MWDNAKPILDKILQSSGPWAVLFVIVVLRHIGYVEKNAVGRLAEKDREIERLVKERNQLQEIILKKRRSSGSE